MHCCRPNHSICPCQSLTDPIDLKRFFGISRRQSFFRRREEKTPEVPDQPRDDCWALRLTPFRGHGCPRSFIHCSSPHSACMHTAHTHTSRNPVHSSLPCQLQLALSPPFLFFSPPSPLLPPLSLSRYSPLKRALAEQTPLSFSPSLCSTPLHATLT